MKWQIPAKTFLLGEYAALFGGPAILLTTTPCFEFSLAPTMDWQTIHPQSPAALWWQHRHRQDGFDFVDPYQGLGGMGASSAQFLAAFLTTNFNPSNALNYEALLQAYWQCAWSGKGLRPSGYDVLAQTAEQCVFIADHCIQNTHPWPFNDIDFVLIHTGKKLATHQHLNTLLISKQIEHLATIVHQGQQSFLKQDSALLIEAINQYYQALTQMHFVAEHTQQLIEQFSKHPNVLAAKGCGAMGADIILLLVKREKQVKVDTLAREKGWSILAQSKQLYRIRISNHDESPHS